MCIGPRHVVEVKVAEVEEGSWDKRVEAYG